MPPIAPRSRLLASTALVLSALTCLSLALPAGAQVQVRSENQVFYPGSARQIHIQLPLGNLEVIGGEGRDMEVEMRLECSREDLAECQKRARKLRLVARTDGQKLRVRLKSTSRGRIRGIKAELTVKLPAGVDLELDQQAGDLTVHGMTANLEIDNGAGDVQVRYPEARVGSVDLKVGVGDVELVTKTGGTIQGTGFPRSLKWTGPGTSDIEIDMTTGDAVVRLE